MDRVFPARPVPRGDTIRTFEHARAPFLKTYVFTGETRDLARFLDRTETTGLLVVRHGVITQEEYLQGADEASHFTSWSIAKSVPSALRGIAVELAGYADLCAVGCTRMNV